MNPRAHTEPESPDPDPERTSVAAGHTNPVRLSSNESSFGPGPKTIEAFKSAAADMHRYPDGSQAELRRAIAEVHGLDMDSIVCGNGSEELIGLAIRSFVNPGDELILSENHFVMCPIYGKSQGAVLVFAPEENYTVSVDALLERVGNKTRMVIFANPNNPTGTFIPGSEVRRLRAELPNDVLLLVDEAYAEYVTASEFEASLGMVEQHDNVIVTRTFSKIYGLAGLRIGWAYCPPKVLEAIQRIRTPFNANSAAMAAAAAAIRDADYVEMVRESNARSQDKIASRVSAMGIVVVPSVTNFYLLDFTGIPGKSGSEAGQFLEARGIVPRPAESNSSSGYLRITVGREDENEAALEALADYMKT